MPSSTRSLAIRRSGNTKPLFTLYHYNLEPMQPAVPRVPQAVLFLAAAKAPKQQSVECQTPTNSDKTKKSVFLPNFVAILLSFCPFFFIFGLFWLLLLVHQRPPQDIPSTSAFMKFLWHLTIRPVTALLALPLKIDLSDNDIPIERLPRADNKLI